jgi:hypothetical protein
MKHCATCFNAAQYLDDADTNNPCNGCNGHDKWVSRDFLANVSDAPVTLKTGVKFDRDKPQWTLVPFKAFDEVVKVLTIGARKYAPDNWKKVPNARQRYIDAAFRHMSAYAGGEKLDSETGKNHLAHAVCCMLFLLAFDLDSSLEKDHD